ncbi:MAG: N-acetyltransferase [Pseudomonadota bacterium]
MSDLDWEIRPYEESDENSVTDLLITSFDTDAEANLVKWLRSGGDAVIELVAESEETILGYIMLSAMKHPEGTLGLAPIATDPKFERNGIASTLIESALALAAANDWKAVFVLGDLKFYDRFGFSAEAAEHFRSPYSGEHFGLAWLDDDVTLDGDRADYADAFAKLG